MREKAQGFEDRIQSDRSSGLFVGYMSQLIAICLLVEMLISWKLWFPFAREFPMISAFSWLDFTIGLAGDGLLCAGLVVSLVFIAAGKFRMNAIVILLSCLFVLILEDIARLQSWVYILVAILTALCLYKKGRENSILTGVVLIVAFVYMWSGIQKLNLGFIGDTFPWMLSAFGIDFRTESNLELGLLHYLFLIVPLIEFLIGVLLLNIRTRRVGIVVGILMHLFILLSIGPTGHNWNPAVWPWNLASILILVLLYPIRKQLMVKEGIQSLGLNKGIVVLFGIMPALNFIGCWDDNLSAGMYSGTSSNVEFYFEGENERELPKFRSAAAQSIKEGDMMPTISKTNLVYWSLFDLKTPFYPAQRYYDRLGRKLCQKLKGTENSWIEVTTKSKFSAERLSFKCECKELLSNSGK